MIPRKISAVPFKDNYEILKRASIWAILLRWPKMKTKQNKALHFVKIQFYPYLI